jgi:hypothetical protein
MNRVLERKVTRFVNTTLQFHICIELSLKTKRETAIKPKTSSNDRNTARIKHINNN